MNVVAKSLPAPAGLALLRLATITLSGEQDVASKARQALRHSTCNQYMYVLYICTEYTPPTLLGNAASKTAQVHQLDSQPEPRFDLLTVDAQVRRWLKQNELDDVPSVTIESFTRWQKERLLNTGS